jgi:hypothetical protein
LGIWQEGSSNFLFRMRGSAYRHGARNYPLPQIVIYLLPGLNYKVHARFIKKFFIRICLLEWIIVKVTFFQCAKVIYTLRDIAEADYAEGTNIVMRQGCLSLEQVAEADYAQGSTPVIRQGCLSLEQVAGADYPQGSK